MRLYLTMPKPGETIREGQIIQWLKTEGEKTEEQEGLVELETEKAVFIYDSPFRGVLQQILVPASSQVPVGAPIAIVEVSQEDGERYLMLGVGLPVEEKESETISSKNSSITLVSSSISSTKTPPQKSSSTYSPLIRKLAETHQLSLDELDQIPRVHSGGRITKEEVLEYLKARSSPKPPYSVDYEDISLSPIRLRIAQKMEQSKREIPHAATSVDVDFTEGMEFCRQHREVFKMKGFSLTPFILFANAVRRILPKFPNFNAHVISENGKIYLRRFHSLHLGMAVDTEQGLFTPVLHRVEEFGFEDLARQIFEFRKKVRGGKAQVEDLTGATFAINNPGAVGGDRAYQIIPPPLVAIIGINRVQKRPWVVNDQIAVREVCSVDLSFDHRVIDGAEAIRFIEAVKEEMVVQLGEVMASA